MPLRLTAGAAAPEELTRLIQERWLRGLEATYTEHDFFMSEKPENRPKPRAHFIDQARSVSDEFLVRFAQVAREELTHALEKG